MGYSPPQRNLAPTPHHANLCKRTAPRASTPTVLPPHRAPRSTATCNPTATPAAPPVRAGRHWKTASEAASVVEPWSSGRTGGGTTQRRIPARFLHRTRPYASDQHGPDGLGGQTQRKPAGQTDDAGPAGRDCEVLNPPPRQRVRVRSPPRAHIYQDKCIPQFQMTPLLGRDGLTDRMDRLGASRSGGGLERTGIADLALSHRVDVAKPWPLTGGCRAAMFRSGPPRVGW